MDPNLVQYSLNYHGDRLMSHLLNTHDKDKLPPYMAVEGKGNTERCFRNFDLQSKMTQFIAMKSDALFKPTEARSNEVATADTCVTLPPLDFFLGLGAEELTAARRHHFYSTVEAGDVVCGVVAAVYSHGVQIMLLCCDAGKAIEVDRLRITAQCATQDLPKINAQERMEDVYTVRDKVRGVIMAVSRDLQKIKMSLLSRDLPDTCPAMKTGLIEDEELPVYYQMLCRNDGRSYSSLLKNGDNFRNPHMVNSMASMLGINLSSQSSLMTGLFDLKLEPSDYGDNMLKEQTRKKAFESVVEGVRLYKKGKLTEAMLCYNHALKYDEDNVEALVARAALEANSQHYQTAVKDLEKALLVDKDHPNARLYLCQTLEAYGTEFELGKNKVAAAECYKRALEVDPEFTAAKDALLLLSGNDKTSDYFAKKKRLEQQAKEAERKKAADKWSPPKSPSRYSKNEGKISSPSPISLDRKGNSSKHQETPSRAGHSNHSEGRKHSRSKSPKRGDPAVTFVPRNNWKSQDVSKDARTAQPTHSSNADKSSEKRKGVKELSPSNRQSKSRSTSRSSSRSSSRSKSSRRGRRSRSASGSRSRSRSPYYRGKYTLRGSRGGPRGRGRGRGRGNPRGRRNSRGREERGHFSRTSVHKGGKTQNVSHWRPSSAGREPRRNLSRGSDDRSGQRSQRSRDRESPIISRSVPSKSKQSERDRHSGKTPAVAPFVAPFVAPVMQPKSKWETIEDDDVGPKKSRFGPRDDKPLNTHAPPGGADSSSLEDMEKFYNLLKLNSSATTTQK